MMFVLTHGALASTTCPHCWVAFVILNTGQCLGSHSSAVKYDDYCRVEECGLEVWNFASNKLDAILIAQSFIEILNVFGGIDGDC